MEFIFYIFCLGSDLHVLLYFPCWNYKKNKSFFYFLIQMLLLPL
jgi:hypothetical protein